MPTYDPESVIFSFNGIRITGFATGTFIQVQRSTETWKTEPGAYGEVTRVKSLDKRGTVTFTTQKEAPINDVLSGIAIVDENTNAGKGVMVIENLDNDTLHFAQESWIVKMPDDEFGTDASQVQWTLECAALRMFIGGSTD